MRVPGRLIGLGVGLVAGLILILAGWKVFLILLAFGSLGFRRGVPRVA